MKTQHTPGPWHRNIPPATRYNTIFAGRYEHIAGIRHAKDGDEAEANHNLICAAPDLLAVLEDAEFLLRKAGQIAGPMQDSFNRSAEDARVVIAKARGES